MTDLMIDEQIEHIRAYLASEEANDVYINLAYTRAMLAIIDELKAKIVLWDEHECDPTPCPACAQYEEMASDD